MFFFPLALQRSKLRGEVDMGHKAESLKKLSRRYFVSSLHCEHTRHTRLQAPEIRVEGLAIRGGCEAVPCAEEPSSCLAALWAIEVGLVSYL